MKKHKICIVGDGLAGLISALIFNIDGLDIDLIVKDNKVIDKDIRVTAISEENYKLLNTSIKNLNKSYFYPVKEINLFYENDKKYKNFMNINDNENLMFFFENAKFKSYLFKLLKKTRVKILKKKITDININENKVYINKKNKTYDLIVLCLGANSPLNKKVLGKRAIFKNYNEFSISGRVSHNLKNLGSQQYFLKEGPLAFLPFKKNMFSFVWSLEDKYFTNHKKNTQEFLKKNISNLLKTKKFKLGPIKIYPLSLLLTKNYFKKNSLILGDGLHSIHPIAGQGFNLILRDIKKLKDLINKNVKLGLPIKDSNILKEFSRTRKPENILFGIGIDFTRKFFKPNNLTDHIKDNILNAFSKSRFLKKVTKHVANMGIS